MLLVHAVNLGNGVGCALADVSVYGVVKSEHTGGQFNEDTQSVARNVRIYRRNKTETEIEALEMIFKTSS